jgi:hypothetical protein
MKLISRIAVRTKWMSAPAVALLLSGCASSGVSEHVARTAAQLQRQSDADSLAAAGVLLALRNKPQALVLLARASAAAPERPELLWLRAHLCEEEPSCNPQADEDRLRQVSPDNGAGWLGALTRAVKAHDEAVRDAALISIGHTGRVDIYWTTLVGRLSLAAAQTGKMSPSDAMINMTGVISWLAIPAYAPASQSCIGERLKRPEILEACRGLASAFENGDTVITEMLGVEIAKRVWPEGSPEWKAAVERRRVYDYRVAAVGASGSATRSQAQALRYLAWSREWHREQEVMRAELLDAGKPPDPPPIAGSSS